MWISRWLIWSALASSAKLGTASQVLLYLPLTLSALSPPAFLLLSLLQTLHSLIHSTLYVVAPSLGTWLPFTQLPVHPFLLLFSFNLFSSSSRIRQWLVSAALLWGKGLRLWTPIFVGMEGLASIIAIQATGRTGRLLADGSETRHLMLLIGAACSYVASATWVVWCYSTIATTPFTSTLFGVAVTALLFLTFIGFAQRRTNVTEASLLALYFAYNVWLCSNEYEDDGYGSEKYYAKWISAGAVAYAPLLQNIFGHLSKLLSFITHILPKRLLISLLYRLTILQLASKILPQIGDTSWPSDELAGGEVSWDEMRPSSRVTMVLLAYRQTIFVTVYSHLLLLDTSSRIWWHWANVFFCLTIWGLELLLTNEEEQDDMPTVKVWKVE